MYLTMNVYETARRLLRAHGAEASKYAALTADEMLSAGKLYERRTWRRVLEVVNELQPHN